MQFQPCQTQYSLCFVNLFKFILASVFLFKYNCFLLQINICFACSRWLLIGTGAKSGDIRTAQSETFAFYFLKKNKSPCWSLKNDVSFILCLFFKKIFFAHKIVIIFSKNKICTHICVRFFKIIFLGTKICLFDVRRYSKSMSSFFDHFALLP